MSMSVTFQTELVAIMEVLTKAAVSDICKLVDDDYAVLRLEISRSHRENEHLKRQLSIQGHTRTGMSQCSVSTGDGGVQLYHDLRRSAKEGHFPEVEGIFGGTIVSRRRYGDHIAVGGENTQMHLGNMSADADEGGVELRLIKVERLEEDFQSSDPPGGLNISEERSMESDHGGRAPIVDTQTAPEELIEQHRTRHNVWEGSKVDAVLKAKRETETVDVQDAGSEHSAGTLNSLEHEYVSYEGPGQLDTFFTQRTVETLTEGPACAYPTESNPESLSVHSELQLIPTVAKDAGKSLLSLGSLEGMNPATFEMGADVCFTWNKETLHVPGSAARLRKLGYGHAAFGRDGQLATSTTHPIADTEHPSCSYSAGSDDGNHLVHSALQHTPSLCLTGSNSDVANLSNSTVCDKSFATLSSLKIQRREKMLTCTFCGKRLSCTQTLEAHHRIHTGERPYSCAHCGKKFNQMSNLRTHQRTHTGQKPYCCAQCGKRFSDPGYLKRHQYVHTGERPFKCTECGKSFSFANNLIRHRSVHTVKII